MYKTVFTSIIFRNYSSPIFRESVPNPSSNQQTLVIASRYLLKKD